MMAHKFYNAIKFLLLSGSQISVRSLYIPSKYSSEQSNQKNLRHHPPEPYKALSALRTEENPDEIVKLFKEASRHPRFHRHRSAYEIAVKKLAGADRRDAVEEILEHQKNASTAAAAEGFMLRIITLYGRAGMPDHAVKTFCQLPKLLGRNPGIKSFNALLSALQQAQKHDLVRDLYRQMTEKHEIDPNLNTFSLVIKSLCEIGCSENALEILDEMRKHGCNPDVEIFNTILRGFYREGKSQGNPRVWEKMSRFGCCPDVNTYNLRILNLCMEGKSLKANELLSVMRGEGIKPNVSSYNMVIKGFCKERSLVEANRVFVGMAGKGCDPNKQSYCTLVYFSCVEEEFEWALQVCDESIRKNWVPGLAIMEMLVEGLVKISKGKEAERIMREARSRVPRDCIKPLDKIEKKLFAKGGS